MFLNSRAADAALFFVASPDAIGIFHCSNKIFNAAVCIFANNILVGGDANISEFRFS